MTEVVIYPALFLTVAFIFSQLVSEVRRRHQFKALMQFRSRLLDRLTSAADIAAVLQSEDGARLLSDVEDYSWGAFHARLTRSVHLGVLLVFVAAGLGTLAWLDSFALRAEFAALAVMAVFVGVGFLVSALVAWRLGVRAGLAPPDTPNKSGKG